MITPELIGYIRGEFSKGRTRGEIHSALVADGGWSELDLNEAFRTVIPMQGFGSGAVASKLKPRSSLRKVIFLVVAIGAAGAAVWYFYRIPVVDLFNSSVNNLTELATPTPKAKEAVIPDNTNISKTNTVAVKDCGISAALDFNNPLTYENNTVLTCLGASALLCEDAKAILKDSLFPGIFQISKNQNTDSQNTCNFRLSYPGDSTLVDVTGRKLAGQYISCPVGIVRVLDETKKIPSFTNPNTGNLSKYASQIYFYGILGLFIEQGLDKNKIEASGCSGGYISSVIESYNKTLEKR
ncbi:hypothetical protein A2818_00525 [Candidatus Nomurabacteria bacterium RIFCSPHIGHO2_01_FULL_40_12]|uniref:Uncharacterized protein n=1 Tax=Candidatus Nomurabacteria bacterium RIFCSPHIGHO2_01_FULL_40_12 TaxID=1801737 RepID=A0A1F6UYT2_9BACT|nr:MAG: hypothetical protein A2818_00525 [Candidatus Nomurabacteria bacterium RIFCSPHIGHO2_01_FULL_40_12]